MDRERYPGSIKVQPCHIGATSWVILEDMLGKFPHRELDCDEAKALGEKLIAASETATRRAVNYLERSTTKGRKDG